MKLDRKLYRFLEIEQLDNGLTAGFEAWLDHCDRDPKDNSLVCVWTIAFCVGKKKKHVKKWFNGGCSVIDEKITGKGDISSLIWAKNKLIELEQELTDGESLSTVDDVTNKIVVKWADNRRRNVYEKYLTKKLGYKIDRYDNQKCLMKIIQKKGD